MRVYEYSEKLEKERRSERRLSSGEKVLCVVLVLLLICLWFAVSVFMNLSARVTAEREEYEKQTSELTFEIQRSEEALSQSKAQIAKVEELMWLEIKEYYNLTVILCFEPRNFTRLEIENITLECFYGFSNESIVLDLDGCKVTLYPNDNETTLFSINIPTYWTCYYTFNPMRTTLETKHRPLCYFTCLYTEVTRYGEGVIQGEIGIVYECDQSIQVPKDTEWYVKL